MPQIIEFPQLDREPVNQLASRMQNDPCLSYRFKNALAAMLNADPVDAANEAELLAYVMGRRCSEMLNAPTVKKIKGGFRIEHNLDPLTGQPWESGERPTR